VSPTGYNGNFVIKNVVDNGKGVVTFTYEAHAGLPKAVVAASSIAWAGEIDSFGFDNNSMGANPGQQQQLALPLLASYPWLMHLDRQLASPMDLLHVSGFQPWELTRRFVTPSPIPNNPPSTHTHQVNWFDETNRLYRLFEVVTARDRMTGTSLGGRIPGMMNLNTMYDPPGAAGAAYEAFSALCDAQGANLFKQGTVDGVWTKLMGSRSPNIVSGTYPLISGTDRPLRSFGTPNLPHYDPKAVTGDPQAVSDDGTPLPGNSGVDDTLFRAAGGAGLFTGAGAFPSPPATELLRKIYGSTTTRSNVFAVWCTVGFFRVGTVPDPVTGQPVPGDQFRPVKLAEELGASTNTNIRPRFFAVIDRSRMVLAPQATTTPPGAFGSVGTTASGVAPNDPQPNVWRQLTAIQVNAMSSLGLGPNNIPWSFQPMPPTQPSVLPGEYLPTQVPGNVLAFQQPPPLGPSQQTSSPVTTIIVDIGTPNEETVALQPVPMFPAPSGNGNFVPWTPPPGAQPGSFWIFAEFQKTHTSTPTQPVTITIPGNPGPQTNFTVNDVSNPGVIAAYGILE
jgi:hypothetical protein